MFFHRNIKAADDAITILDPTAVYVAEYQALRQEVNNRQSISYALVAADLTALGVGLSAAVKYPAILIALAVISSLLWLFWLIHTLQIYRIAAYVALKLRPRLTEFYKCSLLGWEEYVRLLTYSRETSIFALYDRRDTKGLPKISRSIDGIYISLLLGGATPLLLTITAIVNIHHNNRGLTWKFEVGASFALWLYALLRAVATLHTTKEITKIIVSKGGIDVLFLISRAQCMWPVGCPIGLSSVHSGVWVVSGGFGSRFSGLVEVARGRRQELG